MKCEKCNGVGAYSFIKQPTEEEREDSTIFPTRLAYGTGNKVIRQCEKCNGTGEVAN